MIAAAPVLTDLFLSVAAVLALSVLHRTIARRDPYEPLNRRFLFGIRVTLLLFAGRALVMITGGEGFRFFVLLAAALIPIAVLILTEGLLRRHAPAWVKGLIGIGTVVFALSSLWYSGNIDPFRLWALLAFQIIGLGIAGWLVLSRDRASLSATENQTVERLGLSLILLIPLAAADYLMDYMGLTVQVSALGVLFLCWLAIGLGRAQTGHGAPVLGFVIVAIAAATAAALISTLGQWGGPGFVIVAAVMMAAMLVAMIVNDAAALRVEENSHSLLRHMAEAGEDSLTFLRGLQAHPLVEGAVLVDKATLADLDPTVLAAIFAAHPVLHRADQTHAEGAAADHIAHLFARFDATHFICAGRDPLLLLALAMPSLATSPQSELELRAVHRMAMLMPRKDA
jgi:hypothetical protein